MNTRALRFLVPEWIRRRTYTVRSRMRAKLSRLAWDSLRLTFRLDGINIELHSRSDWIVYNEIFVGQVYDQAIKLALQRRRSDTCFRILDLGANVGFFALRCVYIAQKEIPDQPYLLTCVEGSPMNAQVLSHSIERQPTNLNVRVINGLAGRRSGRAKIYESSHGAGSSVCNSTIPEGVYVRYVDLEELLHGEAVDLIKCDIEGAEQEFLTNYGNMLRRTSVVVLELHNELCDVDVCRRLLDEAGLECFNVISERPTTSLELYTRA